MKQNSFKKETEILLKQYPAMIPGPIHQPTKSHTAQLHLSTYNYNGQFVWMTLLDKKDLHFENTDFLFIR